MKISILTLFPEMFDGVFDHSIIKLAKAKKLLSISYTNIRNFGIGKHKIVDDTPYGGGAGIIMRVDVIESAIVSSKLSSKERSVSSLKTKNSKLKERVILLDPQGKTFNQNKAKELSTYDHLIFVCGRYEGVDERVRDLVDEEISIGDYVLTGGEIPTMVIVDSISRLIPGVIKQESTLHESFSTPILEYPQYTRPPVFKGKKVPEIITTGDHKKISAWREDEARKKTQKKRPDLLFKK